MLDVVSSPVVAKVVTVFVRAETESVGHQTVAYTRAGSVRQVVRLDTRVQVVGITNDAINLIQGRRRHTESVSEGRTNSSHRERVVILVVDFYVTLLETFTERLVVRNAWNARIHSHIHIGNCVGQVRRCGFTVSSQVIPESHTRFFRHENVWLGEGHTNGDRTSQVSGQVLRRTLTQESTPLLEAQLFRFYSIGRENSTVRQGSVHRLVTRHRTFGELQNTSDCVILRRAVLDLDTSYVDFKFGYEGGRIGRETTIHSR